jgi:hypothetical protein
VTPSFEFRVTKYDPALRDSGGDYTRDEWTAISDIGRKFNGVLLTEAEYRRIERAYVSSALGFLRECGVPSLAIRDLATRVDPPEGLVDGDIVSLEQLGELLPRVLREEVWCKFEGQNSFVHVGYDYYMYVGVPSACPEAERLAASLGLFVEPFRSPYSNSDAP